ncbi:unnamed protein product [Thlaspi arvense]|uniref:Transposase MuDR plant domain-containing protein n=1 Tax=Thlaspi arvense TaxID=13288 RepID=A0AAU9SMK2_THLAR|nr:unnamed protein product [Thlaspi arvense]
MTPWVFCNICSFDLFFHIGGYWSRDGSYIGEEISVVGRMLADAFSLRSIEMLVVKAMGYGDKMKKVSWFPPDDESQQRVDIDDNEVLGKAVSYALGSGALTLFIVREDDLYLMNRSSDGVGVSLFEDNGDNASGDSDNSVGSSDESSESSESSSDERSDNDGGRDIVAHNEDDGPRKTIDESKYKAFMLGQCYSTIQSFKNAITKYAVKKKYDISYFKLDSKRVVAVCCKRACPWRICGSINSTSSRVVLHVKLLKRNINVPWTICERKRLRCLQSLDDEQAEEFARLNDYALKNSSQKAFDDLKITNSCAWSSYKL